MRTRQVTERIGEYLGPVAWDYDFWSHDWDHDGSVNPECVERGVRNLVRIAAEPEQKWDACIVGCWQPIEHVGMYDGWPYWRPVPSICTRSWLGPEWHSFSYASSVRRRKSR